MICKKCGAENTDGRFCAKCGEPLTEEDARDIATQTEAAEGLPPETVTEESLLPMPETEEAVPQESEITPSDSPITDELPLPEGAQEEEETDDAEEPKSAEVMEALGNLEKYETGTITHPDEKPKDKSTFWCPRNPMLWSFGWLLVFAAALGGLTSLFFSVDLGGIQILYGIVFALFTVAVLTIDFMYYCPAALTLSRMFRGKGVRLEYKLKDYELVEQAEKAKKRNRGFYLAIALFGLAFTIYYAYHLAVAIEKLTIMWISLIFSICVFVIFALLFFLMPKYNYIRMMQWGKRVIIGEKSVYYGGSYYHWRNTQPAATYGNINSRKHELQITFTQEFKNGKSQRRKVELYLPDRELGNATDLLKVYETTAKAYQEMQQKNSILNEKQENNKKKK